MSGVFLFANVVVAQTEINAGFVTGLWYSKIPFFAGDEVRIYAVIQNQSGFDIIGVAQFFEGDKLLGKSEFSVVNGRLAEKWADWKVERGERKISVKISAVKKMEVGKNPEVVDLNENIFISETHFVDIDTDKDGVGNLKDADDDNDGISDIKEVEAGTNPLVFDLPAGEAGSSVDKNTGEKFQAIDINNKDANGNEKFKDAKILAGTLAKKTADIIEKTKTILEEEKEKIDRELAQEKKENTQKEILSQTDENKNSLLATIAGNLPALKELYGFLLGTLIFILNSWWILLGTIFVLSWLLWKMTKKRFCPERF